MNQTLLHRGPDAGDEILFKKPDYVLGLAHRRLSIIDLSENGAQPMSYKKYTIIYNGEVYNFAELKESLVEKGHHFTGASDTEVLLHAYEEWGIHFVGKLIGMFAFVLYDAELNLLYGVRDRAGVKPFFYYKKNQLLLFASELKAFHKHPSFEKEIDFNSVATFLQFGNVPSPYSIFKDCYKLNPGHYFEYRLNSNEFKMHRYWDVYDAYNRPKTKISFHEAMLETENILTSAANYRMIADVPVGVFLSGGYDSACLTALLQHNRTQKLKTFTISVPDIGLNEAPYAKDVAVHLGTEHHEIACSAEEAIKLIDDLPYFYDEPFGDSSAIPTTLVSKMAREKVTVALSADAGDEVFAGYNRYSYLMRYGKKLKQLPAWCRKAMYISMNFVHADNIPVLNKKYNFANRYEKLKQLLNNPSDFQLMWSLSKQFEENELNNLLLKPFVFPATNYTSQQLKPEYYSPLAYMMAIDYQTYLRDDILQKVDRASMAASLEAREPYLDHRLIEWAATLPDEFKYRDGVTKYILKEITHKYIPKSLMDRPKMGFAIPYEDWLKNELKPAVNYFLNNDRIKSQQIFNPDVVSVIVNKFMSGKKELGLKVWYLLMFQMWYEKWLR